MSPTAERAERERRRNDALWQADVAAAQRRWQTTGSVIEAAIRQATGADCLERKRLFHGLSSEVYDAATADGQRVIVRIAHEDVPHYERERWALDRMREAGVPAPAVLLLEHVRDGDESISICVEQKLEGISLGHLVRRLGRNAPGCAKLIRDAGALLARIHAIPTEGYGLLDAQGKGRLLGWDAFMLDITGDADRLARVSEQLGTEQGVLRDTVAILHGHRQLLRRQPSRLVHRDYEPSHIFVNDEDRITGIIDCESCVGGDPAYDLVQWHVIHDQYAPVAHLVHGYAETLSDDFETRLRLGCLRFRLEDLIDTIEDGQARRASSQIAGLRAELAYFRRGASAAAS